MQNKNLFGSQPSGFGMNNTAQQSAFGGLGNKSSTTGGNLFAPAQNNNAFGTPGIGGFGKAATTSAFGATNSFSGIKATSPNQTAFGTGGLLGTSAGLSGFGSKIGGTTSPFGGGSGGILGGLGTTANFGGMNANSGFTASQANPFGGLASSFQQSQPAVTGFGGFAQNTGIGGLGNLGQSNANTGLGNMTAGFNTVGGSTGTGNPPYTPLVFKEKNNQNVAVNNKLYAITAMNAYSNKSFEELRTEDYIRNNKTGGAASMGGATNTGFNLGSTTSSNMFGGLSQKSPTTGGLFGATGSAFGSAPSNFTLGTNQTTTTGLGSNTTGMGFGGFNAAGNGLLGAGNTGGGFGTTPAFGNQTNMFANNAKPANLMFGTTGSGFNGLGGNNTNASKPSIFGAINANNGGGGIQFGTNTPSSGSNATGFNLNKSPIQNPFGSIAGTQPSTTNNMFGSQNTFSFPSFGSNTSATAAKPTFTTGLGNTGNGFNFGLNNNTATPGFNMNFNQTQPTANSNPFAPFQTQTGQTTNFNFGLGGMNAAPNQFGVQPIVSVVDPAVDLGKTLDFLIKKTNDLTNGNDTKANKSIERPPSESKPVLQLFSTTSENGSAVRKIAPSRMSYRSYAKVVPRGVRNTSTPNSSLATSSSILDSGRNSIELGTFQTFSIKQNGTKMIQNQTNPIESQSNFSLNTPDHSQLFNSRSAKKLIILQSKSMNAINFRDENAADDFPIPEPKLISSSTTHTPAKYLNNTPSSNTNYNHDLNDTMLDQSSIRKPMDISADISSTLPTGLTPRHSSTPLVNISNISSGGLSNDKTSHEKSNGKVDMNGTSSIRKLSLTPNQYRDVSFSDQSDTLMKSSLNAPILTKPEYYTEPDITILQKMTESELSKIFEFSVFRKNVGKIQWKGHTDVRGLNLDAIIRIEQNVVFVYETVEEGIDEEKNTFMAPSLGIGLNKPAIVTFYNCFPKDQSSELAKEKFVKKLHTFCDNMDAEFISYSADSGTWLFRVKHFSKYGLDDDDDEADEPDPKSVTDNIQSYTMINNEDFDNDEDWVHEPEYGGLSGRSESPATIVRPTKRLELFSTIGTVPQVVSIKTTDDDEQHPDDEEEDEMDVTNLQNNKPIEILERTKSILFANKSQVRTSTERFQNPISSHQEGEDPIPFSNSTRLLSDSTQRLRGILFQSLNTTTQNEQEISDDVFPNDWDNGRSYRVEAMNQTLQSMNENEYYSTDFFDEEDDALDEDFKAIMKSYSAPSKNAFFSLEESPCLQILMATKRKAISLLMDAQSLGAVEGEQGFTKIQVETAATKKMIQNPKFQKSMHDYSLSMGRSFRVGWSSDGKIVHSGVLLSVRGKPEDTQFGKSRRVAIEKVDTMSWLMKSVDVDIVEKGFDDVDTRPVSLLRDHFTGCLRIILHHSNKDYSRPLMDPDHSMDQQLVTPHWCTPSAVDKGRIDSCVPSPVDEYIRFVKMLHLIIDSYRARDIEPQDNNILNTPHPDFWSLKAFELINASYGQEPHRLSIAYSPMKELMSYHNVATTEEVIELDLVPLFEDRDHTSPELWMKRKNTLSGWLKSIVAMEVPRQSAADSGQYGQDDPTYQRIFDLLSCGRVKEAVLVAEKSGLYRLAMLLCQVDSGDTSLARLIKNQLDQWSYSGSDSVIPRDLLNVYRVLAANLIAETSSETVSLLQGLGWRRALSMLFWYGSSTDDVLTGSNIGRLSSCVDNFRIALNLDLIDFPAPEYQEDNYSLQETASDVKSGLYNLIRLLYDQTLTYDANECKADPSSSSAIVSVEEGQALSPVASELQLEKFRIEKALSPFGYTRDSLDYRTSYLLLVLLECGDITWCDTNGDLMQYASIIRQHIIFQLLSEGCWKWAVFIALQIPSHSQRDAMVKGIIGRWTRHPEEWEMDEESDEMFVIDILGIPRSWMYEASLYRCQYENDIPNVVIQYHLLGQDETALNLLCYKLAPLILLSGQREKKEKLFENLITFEKCLPELIHSSHHQNKKIQIGEIFIRYMKLETALEKVLNPMSSQTEENMMISQENNYELTRLINETKGFIPLISIFLTHLDKDILMKEQEMSILEVTLLLTCLSRLETSLYPMMEEKGNKLMDKIIRNEIFYGSSLSP